MANMPDNAKTRGLMFNLQHRQQMLSIVLALALVLSILLVAGNGTAQAADQTHTVQAGENLTSIAARFGLSVDALAKANSIVNMNNIYAGQVLKIPQTTDVNSNNAPAPATTGEQAYIVQRGETLSGLATRFGVSLYELASSNKLSVMDYIYIGQTLRIPNTRASQPAVAPAPVSTTVAATSIATPSGTATPAPVVFIPTSTPVVAALPTSSIPMATSASTAIPPTQILVPTVAAATKSAEVKPTTATSNSQVNSYTVQVGDTLSGIAKRYGTTAENIQLVNNIANGNAIFAGQRLLIPGSGPLPTATPVPTATPKPPTAKPAVATAIPAQPQVKPSTIVTSETGKWIDVDLSKQTLNAYEGGKSVFSTLVSTGISRYPTVTGTFNIKVKYTSQAMSGGTGKDYYYLPGVPYVMYFYEAYAIHGTYWHNNFGTPMSHGCVNLPTDAAKFMYNWAPIGTTVKVHY